LDLGVEAAFLAWEMARLVAKQINPGQQRALILLLLAVQVASARGSTRLPLSPGGLLARTLEELGATAEERTIAEELFTIAQNGEVGPGLGDLFGGPGAYRPLIIDHGRLYMQKFHVLESRAGERLRERIDGIDGEDTGESADDAVESALREVFQYSPLSVFGKTELDEEQKKAVRAALGGRITVISGRPGSGKTSIVACVLRVLARLGHPPLESIALAAPTGKAADRIRGSVANHLLAIPNPKEADQRLAGSCPPASTLHRLLGYSPAEDRFRHDENNPLAEQFVIVDESSMIDLAMMDRLLRALKPEARLLFLGDADQLPPVDSGAVFRDLCRAKTARERGRVVVLQKSYRAREEDQCGRSILEAAAAINNGRLPAAAVRTQPEKLLFEGVEQLAAENEEQFAAFFARWRELLQSGLPDLAERLSRVYSVNHTGFDTETTGALRNVIEHYERYRILCVTRVTAGKTGSEAANAWFRRQWSTGLKSKGVAPGSFHFQAGEPVLVNRNDYSLRLFNGDSGLILRVKPFHAQSSQAAELMAVFPRSAGFAAYPLEALRGSLEPAWAVTVHKAQGSEYDHVAIMLPGVYTRPLTRELLYTAVSRARKSVVFVGSAAMLNAALQHQTERDSGLADILGGG
jgi:exodeoxyribonuclease V alpha subunit